MSKRTMPLLYIHQTKETETEADNQEFFYHKRLLVTSNVVTKKNDGNKKEENPTNEPSGENKTEVPAQSPIIESEISAKLAYIQTIPAVIEPKIELIVNETKHVGVLEKIEKGIVVLRTRTPPYRVEFPVSQVTAVKVVSL